MFTPSGQPISPAAKLQRFRTIVQERDDGPLLSGPIWQPCWLRPTPYRQDLSAYVVTTGLLESLERLHPASQPRSEHHRQ